MEIFRRGLVVVAILCALAKAAPRSDSLTAPNQANGIKRSVPEYVVAEDSWFRNGRSPEPIRLPKPPCPDSCQVRDSRGECITDWKCVSMGNL